MIDEFRKSISSTLYERVVSPLYGTLLVTWLTWNWKIVYLTIFVSETEINEDRISYILNNFYHLNYLIYYPLLTSAVLLVFAPILTNGAYWLHLIFHKWKLDKKHEIQKKQRITLEQSIALMFDISEKEKQFENLLTSRDAQIENLKILLQDSKKTTEALQSSVESGRGVSTTEAEFEAIAQSGDLDGFISIKDHLLRGDPISPENIPNFETAIGLSLLRRGGDGFVTLSPDGKSFFRWIILNQAIMKVAAR